MQTLTQRRSVPVDAAKTAAIFGTLRRCVSVCI